MTHPHEDLLRREAEATARGASLPEEFYTEDHVLHFPGRSPLAGEYRGHAGLAEFGRKIGASVSSLERELHEAIANDEHGVQLITVRAERSDGARHEWRAVWVFHFREGRIAESWGHPVDQQGLDDFLSG